jgi:hypothetical protein
LLLVVAAEEGLIIQIHLQVEVVVPEVIENFPRNQLHH